MNHSGSSQGQSGVVQPLLTDLYQITMAYAYWKSGKINDRAVFDLFFRKNPFHGEFTVFAGLEDCLKFVERFKYSASDIDYLKEVLPAVKDEAFFQYLANLTTKDVTIYAMAEGTVCFPKIPLLRVEGPLIVCQLLETTLLTLVNFASLMATNAARYRLAAGNNINLLEFGLRRAQGPDGGLSASKYSYMGGFDGTSNVLAGKLFNIPVKGTHAHSYVTSFNDFSDLHQVMLAPKKKGEPKNLLELAVGYRTRVEPIFNAIVAEASDGELAAFISFAIAFPDGFLALVDTYDVKKSGLLNFCAVALALNELGYRALGIRLDSGDLAYLSVVAREYFTEIGQQFKLPWFANLTIIASNDINEETILSLNDQGHKINCYGIGTHLVTCQKQPALGCVYKLVELNGMPRMKLSQDVEKAVIPGRKDAYRLFSENGDALIDLLQRSCEPAPQMKDKVLCRHPFEESKRAYVIPSTVQPLLLPYFQNGKAVTGLPNLQEIRERVQQNMRTLRSDIKRYLNPTPYKVAVSVDLYAFLHEFWLQNAPIGELS